MKTRCWLRHKRSLWLVGLVAALGVLTAVAVPPPSLSLDSHFHSHAHANLATNPARGQGTTSGLRARPRRRCRVRPAPFPSRLHTSGRQIVDSNGYTLSRLKGFDIQIGPWSQTALNEIAAEGGKVERLVVFWDSLEPSQGVISSTYVSELDQHIQWAQSAGIYTELDLHLNVGRDPSWTSGQALELDKYTTYGQLATQYLANRYGNAASAHYTNDVIGFGVNEPPPDTTTDSIPSLEAAQREMISWFRATGYAPEWIGFVAEAYAAATPIYNPTFQASTWHNADPHAYDTVGGNVILDIHDYGMGCNSNKLVGGMTVANCDGRQWNGMPYPDWQGGEMVSSGAYPPANTTESQTLQQFYNYIAPYKNFSLQANIPLMIGEWGWQPSVDSNPTAYINDKMKAWSDAGAVIEMQWDYNVTQSQDPWAARPGGVWQPITNTWMAAS
jgi:hypothetical protein